MAMMSRLFVALTTNSKRYSGTRDTFNLTIDKGAEKLADVNFGTGIEDGEGFVWNIPVGTFESDDATLMTFVLRGNDLLRRAIGPGRRTRGIHTRYPRRPRARLARTGDRRDCRDSDRRVGDPAAGHAMMPAH